jgi:hypothetical protein
VHAPVGAVDNHVLSVRDLINETDGDDLADDRRAAPAALEHGELGAAALDAGFLERPLHHAIRVGALAQAPQLALELCIEAPDTRAALGRQHRKTPEADLELARRRTKEMKQ